MTIAQRLGQLHTEREMKSNATDFARLAHALLKYD
jgi:hypothetical protein